MERLKDVNPTRTYLDLLQSWWTSLRLGLSDRPSSVQPTPPPAISPTVSHVGGGAPSTVPDAPQVETEVDSVWPPRLARTWIRSSNIPDENGDTIRPGSTIVGIFESESQARFAAAWLKSLSHLDILGTRIVPPSTSDAPESRTNRSILPDPIWSQLRELVSEKHTLLVVTIDDCYVHQTRAVLDEDVGSVTTLVFPQSPAKAS